MSLKIETNNTLGNDINYQSNLKFFLHELLNPLNIISNCAELIDVNDKITTSQFADIILQQVEICNYLSQNMLTKIVKKQENSINLCHFLIDIKDKFEINFSTNINLELKVNCHHLKLKFNHVYLKIILDNILKNAYSNGNNINIILKHQEKENDKYMIIVENLKDNNSNINTSNDTSINNNTKSNTKRNTKSNMVGIELIDNLCTKMDIDWNLFEEEDNYKFILILNKNRNN